MANRLAMLSSDESLVQEVIDKINRDLVRTDKHEHMRCAYFGRDRSKDSREKTRCTACSSSIGTNTRVWQMICKVYFDAHPALARLTVSWWCYTAKPELTTTRQAIGTDEEQERVDEFEVFLTLVNRCEPCNQRLARAVQSRLQIEWQLEPAMLQAPHLANMHALFTIPPLLNLVVAVANPLHRTAIASALPDTTRPVE